MHLIIYFPSFCTILTPLCICTGNTFFVLKKNLSADNVHGFMPRKGYLLLLFNAGRQVVLLLFTYGILKLL